MKNNRILADGITKSYIKKKRIEKLLKVATPLAAVVVFCVTYWLILPATAMQKQLICEKEEHVHTEECYSVEVIPGHYEYEEIEVEDDFDDYDDYDDYEDDDESYDSDSSYSGDIFVDEVVEFSDIEEVEEVDTGFTKTSFLGSSSGSSHGKSTHYEMIETWVPEHEERTLICEKEEHIHTDECYDAPASDESPYACGYDYEHVHDESCYYEDGTLKCTLVEHTHTKDCLKENDSVTKTGLLGATQEEIENGKVNVTYEDAGDVYILTADITDTDPDEYIWQWQYSLTGEANWKDIEGATELTYTVYKDSEAMNWYIRFRGYKIDTTTLGAYGPVAVLHSTDGESDPALIATPSEFEQELDVEEVFEIEEGDELTLNDFESYETTGEIIEILSNILFFGASGSNHNDNTTPIPAKPIDGDPLPSVSGSKPFNGNTNYVMEYVSDDSTSNLEDKFNGESKDDGKILTDKSVTYGEDSYNAISNYDDGDFSVTLSALAQQYTNYTDSEFRTPVDVVLAIDMSSSMYDKVNSETGLDRYETAAIAADILVQKVMDYGNDNRVGVVTFNSKPEVLLSLGRYTTTSTDERKYITSDSNHNIKVVENKVKKDGETIINKSIKCDSGTYWQTGFNKAYLEFENVESKTDGRTAILIVLSDGTPYIHDNEHWNDKDNFITTGKDDTSVRDTHAFYTILSGNYYKDLLTTLYRNRSNDDSINAKIYTIGIGIEQHPKEDGVARAVLDPSKENIDYLDSEYLNGGFYDKDGQNKDNKAWPTFRKYLDNLYCDKSGDKGGVNGTIPSYLLDENGNVDYNYTDDSYYDYNYDPYALAQIMQDMILKNMRIGKTKTSFSSSSSTVEPVVITDTIGAGMEFKGVPVLRIRNVEGGSNTSDNYIGIEDTEHPGSFTFSGTVKSKVSGTMINLSSVTVQVSGNTVTWTIPGELVPELCHGKDGTDWYYQELPIRLIYKVGLTEQSKTDVLNPSNYNPDGSYKSGSFYTNAYGTSIDNALAVSYAAKDNPYYTNKTKLHNVFSSNETGTRSTSYEIVKESQTNSYRITNVLGNNGKLVFKHTPITEINVKKEWTDNIPNHPDVVINLNESGTTIDSITLSKASSFEGKFKDLDSSKDYTIAEVVPDGYKQVGGVVKLAWSEAEDFVDNGIYRFSLDGYSLAVSGSSVVSAINNVNDTNQYWTAKAVTGGFTLQNGSNYLKINTNGNISLTNSSGATVFEVQDGKLKGNEQYIKLTNTYVTTVTSNGSTFDILKKNDPEIWVITNEPDYKINVEKVWSPAVPSGTDSLTISLYKTKTPASGTDPEVVERVKDLVLTGSGTTWTGSFQGLTSLSSGYSYYVMESSVEDFNVTYNNSATVLIKDTSTPVVMSKVNFNTNNLASVSITNSKKPVVNVTKIWDPEPGNPVNVTLYKVIGSDSGVDIVTEVRSATIEGDSWQTNFSALETGTTYYVREDAVEGYITSYSPEFEVKIDDSSSELIKMAKAVFEDEVASVSITNTKKAKISVTKNWTDDKVGSSTVAVNLYKATGKKSGKDIVEIVNDSLRNLVAADSWTTEYEVLDTTVTYYVMETSIDDYTVSYTNETEVYLGDDIVKMAKVDLTAYPAAITITNTKNSHSIRVKKSWGADGTETPGASEVYVQLHKQDGSAVVIDGKVDQKLSSENDWTFTYQDLEKGTYTITEVPVSGYYATIDNPTVTLNGSASETVDVVVTNIKGSELPMTGGIGTAPIYALGLLLLSGLFFLL